MKIDLWTYTSGSYGRCSLGTFVVNDIKRFETFLKNAGADHFAEIDLVTESDLLGKWKDIDTFSDYRTKSSEDENVVAILFSFPQQNKEIQFVTRLLKEVKKKGGVRVLW